MVSDSLGVATNQVGQSGDNYENVGNYGWMIVVDLIIMFINRSALPLRRVWQNSLKIAGVFRSSSYYFLFRHLNSTTSHIINTSQFSLETNPITIILPKSSPWSAHPCLPLSVSWKSSVVFPSWPLGRGDGGIWSRWTGLWSWWYRAVEMNMVMMVNIWEEGMV